MSQIKLKHLLDDIRGCQLCKEQLSHSPNPVVRAHNKAKILLIGQAPGVRVHRSSVPWDDQSGERLRSWMNIDTEQFYDTRNIAIVPMGFCYPGKGRSGDLPPRKECAPAWHQQLLALLPNVQLTLLIGKYAQDHYLDVPKNTLTETVKCWRDYRPKQIPLPHPSPRNQIWLKKNPWFSEEVLPYLRRRVKSCL